MIERGRFAPTPSGALHIGSARTALASALAAWRAGGVWALRIEDLDVTRTVPGAVDAMLDDLRWLGLAWDEGPGAAQPHAPYRQSERSGLYRAALDVLRREGRVYPCACSRREVEGASTAPHGAEPVYPGTCATRDPEEVMAAARAKGRHVSWRFRVGEGPTMVTVRDEVAGDYTQDVARDVGDFVVFRADGVAAYQLAVVVDDAVQEVTEVVRGDDLLASAPRQVLLYEALGARAPRWAHVPLVLGDDGARLAKRHGAMGVRALRERGHDPKRVLRELLASLGLSGVDDAPVRRLAARWDPSSVPRSSPRWDVRRERFEAS
jgi:glutamyl-tRNA synthetase